MYLSEHAWDVHDDHCAAAGCTHPGRENNSSTADPDTCADGWLLASRLEDVTFALNTNLFHFMSCVLRTPLMDPIFVSGWNLFHSPLSAWNHTGCRLGIEGLYNPLFVTVLNVADPPHKQSESVSGLGQDWAWLFRHPERGWFITHDKVFYTSVFDIYLDSDLFNHSCWPCVAVILA